MRPSDRVGDLLHVATQLPCPPCDPQALLPDLSELRLRVLQPVEQLMLDFVPDLPKLLQHLPLGYVLTPRVVEDPHQPRADTRKCPTGWPEGRRERRS
jgi:hypothetical protein